MASIQSAARMRKRTAKPRDILEWLPVNENLLEYPIARHARAKLVWKRSSKGYWWTAVSDRIVLRLPLDFEPRRHINGFDMALLLTVTAMAIRLGENGIAVANNEILRNMRLPITGSNRAKVADALRLLENVTIVQKKWLTEKASSRAGRAGRRQAIEINRPLSRKRGEIWVDDAWLEFHWTNFRKIWAPLPVDAKVQNMLLLILGRKKHKRPHKLNWRHEVVPHSNVMKLFDSRRQITRRIGLNGKRRNDELLDALGGANEWLGDLKEGKGEMLDFEFLDDGRFSVTYYLQPVPNPMRKKRKAQNGQMHATA